jgi:hypothetical protein
MDAIWLIAPTRPNKMVRKKIALTIFGVLMAVVLGNEVEWNVVLGR